MPNSIDHCKQIPKFSRPVASVADMNTQVVVSLRGSEGEGMPIKIKLDVETGEEITSYDTCIVWIILICTIQMMKHLGTSQIGTFHSCT